MEPKSSIFALVFTFVCDKTETATMWEQFDYHVLDVLKLLCKHLHKNLYVGLVSLTLMKRYWESIGARTTINPCVLLLTCTNVAMKLDDAKHKHMGDICSALTKVASTESFFSLWKPKSGYSERALRLEIPVLKRIRFCLFVPNAHALLQKEKLCQREFQEAWAILTLFHASGLIFTKTTPELVRNAVELATTTTTFYADEKTRLCINLAWQEAHRKTDEQKRFYYETLFI